MPGVGGERKVCYNKFWKILIDRQMRRIDLRDATGISTTSLAKLGRNDNVSLDVLTRICAALNCNIGDIMDVLPDEEAERTGVSTPRVQRLSKVKFLQ